MCLGITNWRFKKIHFQSALLQTVRGEEQDSPAGSIVWDVNSKHSLPGQERVAQHSYCQAEDVLF